MTGLNRINIINMPLVLAIALALWLVRGVRASIIHDSVVQTRYFTVLDDSNSGDTFSPSWRYWLRAYRAINASRCLAHKLSRSPIQLTSQAWSFADWNDKRRALGLKEEQLQGRPVYLYTLHLASFQKVNSLNFFVERQWRRKHLNQCKVYHNIPKRVRLWVYGEMSFKDDPLYSQSELVGGKTMYRLNYGVYENLRDVDADRRVLEHLLGFHLGVLRKEPTTAFIDRVWIEPTEYVPFSDWEYPNG